MYRGTTGKRLTYFLGIGLAVLMALAFILPSITQTMQQPQNQPTATAPPPAPTFPPPMTDFSGIDFSQDYLHPTGLYTVHIPSGWEIGQPNTTSTQAQVSMNNPDALSIIEVSVEQPAEPVTNLDELSSYYNEGRLARSWVRYTGWDELARRQENDRLLIDFDLDRNQQQFLARQATWITDGWIYMIRVVVPNNARDLLFFMLDAMSNQIEPYTRFMETPVDWRGYYDTIDQHILRHPADWELTDGALGQPTSFVAPDGTRVRVEAQEQTIENEDVARAWVEALRTGYEVVSVEPVSRAGGEGFSVAFSYTDPDGESQSGMAILLNGEAGKLHALTTLLPEGGLDLNTEEDRAAHQTLVSALDTFSLITGLNLQPPEPPFTPEITLEAPVEMVPEVTPEATEEAEVTPETTAEADSDE